MFLSVAPVVASTLTWKEEKSPVYQTFRLAQIHTVGSILTGDHWGESLFRCQGPLTGLTLIFKDRFKQSRHMDQKP